MLEKRPKRWEKIRLLFVDSPFEYAQKNLGVTYVILRTWSVSSSNLAAKNTPLKI